MCIDTVSLPNVYQDMTIYQYIVASLIPTSFLNFKFFIILNSIICLQKY